MSTPAPAVEHWQSRPEGGARFAMRLIRFAALHLGRGVTRPFLYPITLYFWMRRGPERRASRQFLKRVLGYAPSHWHVLKHLHSFASITLDRVFFLARGEQQFEIEAEGLALLDERIAMGRGVILMGSHHGSFEAMRAIHTRRPEVRMRVLLDKQKTSSMTELLEALSPDVAADVIDASRDGTSVTLAMAEACEQGALVGLLADRARATETVRSAPFLGKPAAFPAGPWLLAHVLGAPVMLCFGLYLGGNRYRLVFEPVADRVVIARCNRGPALDALITAYAQRLEHYVRLAPYNWFNFYDFWQQDARPDRMPDDRPAGASPVGAERG